MTFHGQLLEMPRANTEKYRMYSVHGQAVATESNRSPIYFKEKKVGNSKVSVLSLN